MNTAAKYPFISATIKKSHDFTEFRVRYMDSRRLRIGELSLASKPKLTQHFQRKIAMICLNLSSCKSLTEKELSDFSWM